MACYLGSSYRCELFAVCRITQSPTQNYSLLCYLAINSPLDHTFSYLQTFEGKEHTTRISFFSPKGTIVHNQLEVITNNPPSREPETIRLYLQASSNSTFHLL
ncbi:unnamed protein product [Periconia digitata]|uniref:Uncharacterized protein n=1 Tax=Periconia digitata TaxID=1303443 RepID=A0A9W4XNZ7_9PLEO|nr:unnamed protein product [Periconia digitata]